MAIPQVFERTFARIFCGPECWLVTYSLSTGRSGEVISGTTKTYLPLSKAKDQIDGDRLGRQIAQDIGRSASITLGVHANGVTIHRVERIW